MALTASLLVALAPAASAEDSVTDLGPRAGSGDLVVAGDTVAISLGDRIAIADTTGEVRGTVTGLSGASGLALTADGSRLYAALMDSNEVAEINTVTRDITRRIDLAAYGCPFSLALDGDRLWVGYGCSAVGALSLNLLVPAAEPIVVDNPVLTSLPYVAAAGNTLVVGEILAGKNNLFVYDVSGGAPVLRGNIEGPSYNHSLEDLALTPDGSHIIAAFLNLDSFEMWDATTLAHERSYEKGLEFAEGYPQTVAISADGAYFAGGRILGVGMTLYDTASGAATYTADPPEGELVNGSAAFSGRDISSLLNTDTNHLLLWRLQDVTLPGSTLTLSAAPGATAGQPLTLTGQLTFDDNATPGAQSLAVTRTLSDGTRTDLPAVMTVADGSFTITDTPPAGEQVTYAVRWNGDGSHRWSKASTTTTVRYATTLQLTGPTSAAAGTTLVFTGLIQAPGTTAPRSSRLTVQRIRNDGDGEPVQRSVGINSRSSYTFTD